MEPENFIALLAKFGDIPLYQWSETGKFLQTFPSDRNSLNLPVWWKTSISKLMENFKVPYFSYYELPDLPICFCAVRPESSEENFVWGPIQYRSLSFSESTLFKNLIDEDLNAVHPPLSSLDSLTAQIACFISAVNKEPVTQKNVWHWIEQHISQNGNISTSSKSILNSESGHLKYKLRINDFELKNHTYAEEKILWDLVKSGDVGTILKTRNQPILKHPLVVENNPLRNEEYMAVSGITLMSRSAIEAGVSSAESFFLSDLYLKRISECLEIPEIDGLVTKALIDFTSLVKKKKESNSGNHYVEECKTAISNNIFTNIGLATLAQILKVQPAYLSRLFKKHEGSTVTEYIHREKINWAKKMLTYSNRNIADIAYYLQFNNQSYFGKIFKKETGFSPQAYRQKYYSIEKID